MPCDLDLADAEDREEAERLYVEQATALRDALVGADTVLDVWREPLGELAGSGVAVDHSVSCSVRLPAPPAAAHRAGRAPSHSSSSRRCAARARWPRAARRWGSPAPSRTSAASIRWPTTPSAASRTSCELAAEHARALAERLDHQEASVQRFLELSDSCRTRSRRGSRRARLPCRRCAAARHRRDRARGRRCSWSSARCWPGCSAPAAPSDAAITSLVQAEARGDTAEVIVADHGLPGQRRVPRPRRRQRRRAEAPRQVSIAEINPSADVLARQHRRHRPGGLGGGRLAAERSVRARPPAGNVLRASRSSCWWSAGGSRATPTAPAVLSAPGAMRRRGPGGAAARGPGAARGAGRRSPRRPCSRRRTRAGTASGSGMPPRGGFGGLRRTLGPAAPAVVTLVGTALGADRTCPCSAGNISSATQPSPSRCTPAIQSMSAAPLMALG